MPQPAPGRECLHLKAHLVGAKALRCGYWRGCTTICDPSIGSAYCTADPRLLNCSGQRDKPLRIHSLGGCPPTVRTLICSNTLVSKLGLLAACTSLQSLDCSNTGVSELGPLATCTLLQTLDCSNTGVSELGPLAACTLLQTLNCSMSMVVELGPRSMHIAAEPQLQLLHCGDRAGPPGSMHIAAGPRLQ